LKLPERGKGVLFSIKQQEREAEEENKVTITKREWET
jgi:hypothetical protein